MVPIPSKSGIGYIRWLFSINDSVRNREKKSILSMNGEMMTGFYSVQFTVDNSRVEPHSL